MVISLAKNGGPNFGKAGRLGRTRPAPSKHISGSAPCLMRGEGSLCEIEIDSPMVYILSQNATSIDEGLDLHNRKEVLKSTPDSS